MAARRNIRFGPGLATVLLVVVTGGWLLGHAVIGRPVGDYSTESDFYGGYAAGARALQQGRLDVSRYTVIGPVYESALAVAGALCRDLFLGAKLLSVLAAVVTLAGWAAIARARLGPGAALALVAFTAGNSDFLRYGYSATTDGLALATQTLALLALLHVRGRTSGIVAGASVAVAVLTRYSSLYLLPLAILLAIFDRPVPGTRRRGGAGAPLGLLLGTAFLVLGSWTAFSLSQGTVPGSILVSSFGYYVDQESSRNAQDAAGLDPAAEPDYPSLGQVVEVAPRSWIKRLARAIPAHARFDARHLLGPAVAWLAGLGLILALASGGGRILLPFGLAAGLFFAELLPVFASERYSLPLVPLYLAGAAWFLGRGSPRIPSRVLNAMRAMAAVVFLWSTRDALADQFELARHLPREVPEVARILHRRSPPDARVISRKGHLGYYAERATVAFPRLGTVRELGTWAHAQGADFLYYSWYEARLRPEFLYLLDSTATLPGLEAVAGTDVPPSVLFAIGPAFGTEPEWMADPELRAVHEARAFLRIAPDTLAGAAHLILARHLFERGGSLRELMHHARAATRSGAERAVAWTILGKVSWQRGEKVEARVAFERGLEIDPANAAARFAMGWILLDEGRFGAAGDAWRPLVSSQRDPATLRRMIELYAQLGDSAALGEARASLAAIASNRR